MKAIFLIGLCAVIAVGSGIIGYMIGSSTIKDGKITIIKSTPEIHEVIKYVNVKDHVQVDAAIKSKIDIRRMYSDMHNGIFTANISANDGFKSTSVTDTIRVTDTENYTTDLIIGAAALVAGGIATVYALNKTKVIKFNMAQGRF